ncbi:MAG: CapA family protein [Ruminococcaceae bacterium]|nr:CapA family protein [Oscillospiraceae bacterium]
MKLTVIGDIMCEPSIMDAGKLSDGTYSYDFVFENAKRIWDNSDFVVGNLEFPLAEDMQLTSAFDVFNAPQPFGQAAKDAGLDLVSVVNNHTLDRGWEGATKTMRYLEKIGLPYTGAFKSAEDRKEAYYVELGGAKIAIIAYTYSTNCKLEEKDEKELEPLINYLRPSRALTYTPEVQEKFKTWIDKLFPKMNKKKRNKLKKLLGVSCKPFARADDLVVPECQRFLDNLRSDIRKAKENADFVLFYPHVGGQFNVEPGKFSELVFQTALEEEVDAIFASHSHIVQKAEWKGKIPCAWSMGNYNMDSTSKIVVKTDYPEIGIIMHLYLDGKNIEKVTFSMTKAIWEEGKYRTYPVSDLYEKLNVKGKEKLSAEVRAVLERIYSKKYEGELFLEEYTL